MRGTINFKDASVSVFPISALFIFSEAMVFGPTLPQASRASSIIPDSYSFNKAARLAMAMASIFLCPTFS